ncbi:MAG: hypothetical protein ACYDBY_14560 [Thermoanaerobaculia bacterium]
MLVFLCVSLLLAMTIRQEASVVPGSVHYWVIVGSAALLPALSFRRIATRLVGDSWTLLAFLVVAGGWQLARGDARAAVRLALLTWVLAWLSTESATVRARTVGLLFVGLVVVGVVVYARFDLNRWGILPGTSASEYGIWRVSFFPNIAYTGLLSLAAVMILTRDRETARSNRVALAIAAYFLLFCFVRAAFVAAVLYGFLRWWLSRRNGRRTLVWAPLLTAAGVTLAVAASPVVLERLQDSPFASRLLLRGETTLTREDIYVQLYRPFIWSEHFKIFAASPWMMGWGDFEFDAMKSVALVEGHYELDTVSLPTRLLASYGLPSLLFMGFLIGCLLRNARRGDQWACACFPSVFALMTLWGSSFHPTDAVFSLFLMMVVRGGASFPIDGNALAPVARLERRR